MPSSISHSESIRTTRDRFVLPLLLISGLLLRLIFWPFAQVAYGDAVMRIFVTLEGLEHPVTLLKSNWGVLHFLLMAGALKIWFDPVRAPVFLHILLSIATAIPVFLFVQREWSRRSAIYVTAATLLYPVAIRQSYLPLTETPFVFFVLWAVDFISRARHHPKVTFVIAAGIFQTLACALRMEAWILIPLLALLFRTKPKFAALFVLFASLFPAISMARNYFTTGDPLPWITTLDYWMLHAEATNEGLTLSTVVRRLVYYPVVLFFGITPFLFLVCLAGILSAIRRRKPQMDWLIPSVGLLCVYIVQAARGLVMLDSRFSLILGYLILPFAAEVVEKFYSHKIFRVATLIILLSMIPFSYSRVVLSRTMGPDFPNPFPADLEIIPKASRRAVQTAKIVADHVEGSKNGLIVDFFKWKDTRYVALMSGLEPAQIWFMPGARYQEFNQVRFVEFVHRHPTGILIRSDDSRHIAQNPNGASFTFGFENRSAVLSVLLLQRVEDLTIYRYEFAPR